jgi:uncharacterized protein (DUF427 family)
VLVFMARAVWNGEKIAESDDIVVVEGNAYFPREALRDDFVEDSSHRTHCGWKGEASYFDVVVNGERNANAAWYYPDPSPEAKKIRDRVAFWRGVEVEPEPAPSMR